MPKCKECKRTYSRGCALDKLFPFDDSLNCPPCDLNLYSFSDEKREMSQWYTDAGAGQLQACEKCPIRTQCMTIMVAV